MNKKSRSVNAFSSSFLWFQKMPNMQSWSSWILKYVHVLANWSFLCIFLGFCWWYKILEEMKFNYYPSGWIFLATEHKQWWNNKKSLMTSCFIVLLFLASLQNTRCKLQRWNSMPDWIFRVMSWYASDSQIFGFCCY